MAKILVVDDDRDILDMVKLLLNTQRYSVETIFKGDQVLEQAKIFMPDLILLDVKLGGHDGRTLCKHIKSVDTLKHIPIILFSATPGLAETYAECEATDFVAKPFDAFELIKKIEKHLQ